jgi:hypothetical protein
MPGRREGLSSLIINLTWVCYMPFSMESEDSQRLGFKVAR